MGQQTNLPGRDRFDLILAKTKIEEGVRFDAPLLVIEISGEIADLDQNRLCDFGHQEFAFGVALFDETLFVERAKDALQAATSGLLLAMPHDITATIEKLGIVAYAVEETTLKPIYSSSPTASAFMSSHSSLRETVFTDAGAYTRSL
jgi:hypothetical protein